MLTKVEARTPNGDVLFLELDDISDGLVLQNIDGLDPVKASLSSSTFARLPGAQFQASHRDPRNIVITIGLEPDYFTTSVRDLRNRLYQWFMPEAVVNLRFYDSDGLTLETVGHVETMESDLFTNEPRADISVMCFDPDLIDIETIELDGSTVSDSTETAVAYDGTSDTGLIFTLNVDRTLAEFTIYQRLPDGSVSQLDFAGSLVAGDVVKIDTIRGEKSATLTRGGTESSLLYGIPSTSAWLQLKQGANTLRVYATGAAIPYTIMYTPRYGGL